MDRIRGQSQNALARELQLKKHGILELVITASPLAKAAAFFQNPQKPSGKTPPTTGAVRRKGTKLGKELGTLQETDTDYLHSDSVSIQLKSAVGSTLRAIHILTCWRRHF